jgi:hypothetical protein
MNTPTVGVDEIAESRGWSRYQAYRFLRRVEREHPEAVERVGPRGILRADPGKLGALFGAADPATKRIFDVERRQDETEKRVDALAAEFAEFRRQSNEWFRKRLDAPSQKK